MRGIGAGIFLALFLLLSATAVSYADDIKIGFIDSERIFASYEGTSEAQAEFNADVEQWTAEAARLRAELEKITEEFQNQSLILSEAKRREREAEIQSKRNELDTFAQEIWGPNGKVAQRNEQLTRPIVDKIREVLNEIGEQEGYSIIFDATDGNVVFADSALDLTERVVEMLNQKP